MNTPPRWLERNIFDKIASLSPDSYKGLQAVTLSYKRLQAVTHNCKGLQAVTDSYKGLHAVTLSYKGLQAVTDSRDFKQRQPGRRREHHRIRENPKSPLRMTGGEQVDVLRLDPTRV